MFSGRSIYEKRGVNGRGDIVAAAKEQNAVARVTVDRFISGRQIAIATYITVEDLLTSGASMRELVELAARNANKTLDTAALMLNSAPPEWFD
jgi:orotate phosphoribosyltransferase